MSEAKKVRPLDAVSVEEISGVAPCKCGCTLWIVDGDPTTDRWWLLCYDLNRVDCVECQELPLGLEVRND